MEQQTYKTDAAIYDVLEREIIDLTIRPGSSLSENPLCTRFGAPRSLIRVVLQKLQENGLVKIVPYKGTTVTRLNRRIVDELIYERTAVEARVLRDFSPRCTPEQRALIRKRAAAYEALHDFMYSTVYVDKVAKKEEQKVDKLIRELYAYFKDTPTHMPQAFLYIMWQEGVDRAVTDYISGMSDEYATSTFESLFVPQKWQIL